jgi:hypothetical protein
MIIFKLVVRTILVGVMGFSATQTVVLLVSPHAVWHPRMWAGFLVAGVVATVSFKRDSMVVFSADS